MAWVTDNNVRAIVAEEISRHQQMQPAELDGPIRELINSHLIRRNADFVAQQELKIRDSMDQRQRQIEADRRSRVQFLSALGGVSLIAIVALALDMIDTTAKEASEAAITDALDRVAEAENRLDESAKQFEDIKAQIVITSRVVEDTRVQVRKLLGDVEHALGTVRAAEGGVSIANELTRVYRELESIKLRQAAPRPRIENPSGESTIGELFPGSDVSIDDEDQPTEGN